VLEESLRKKRLIRPHHYPRFAGDRLSGRVSVDGTLLLYHLRYLAREQETGLKYIMIAVAVTVATYLSFFSLMGVPLLRGLLWG